MCSIIYLKPNAMIPYEMLENAVYNNWHSYGLVTKVDGKLDIKKKVPESGEVDPKEVFKLLQDDIEYERFLHLRHNTAGATTDENTHPFEIFYDEAKGRHVVFMHNGTMHPFVSKKTVDGKVVDDNDGPSDTKNFVDQILIPYISAMDFGGGKGDITHPLVHLFIKKFWCASNRGVLIASDQEAMFIDDWKMVGPEGSKFLASNDTYFDKVIRGPEHTRRLVREANEKTASNKNKSADVDLFARLQDFKLDTKHAFYSLKDSMLSIFDDWEVWERSGAVAVGYATQDELEALFKDKATCLALMDWIFTDYAQLYKEHLETVEKHDKATKLIATLVNRLKEQDKEAA